jgi:tetratricopeptide (TPR) repeat protein
VELARELRHANNFLSAEKLLLKVLDWNENDISALKELAENNFLRKGVTKTVEICERIYSILNDKTDERTFQLLAGSLRALKKYENAEYFIQKGLQLYPQSKAILQEYAELFMSQKQWNLAVESWNNLLNQYPEYSFARFRLGNTYESNDDYKNAISLYKEALKTGKPNVLWSNQLNITFQNMQAL